MSLNEVLGFMRSLEGRLSSIEKRGAYGVEGLGGGVVVQPGAVDLLGDVPGQVGGVGAGGSDGGFGVVDRSGASSSGSGSWADAVEEEEELKASGMVSDRVWGGNLEKVKMPPGAPKADRMGGVEFGSSAVDGSGFYADYVRTSAVRELVLWLGKFGVKISKTYREELALARYASACVPPAFDRGRERLKALAKVGDNVLTLALSDQLYFEKSTSADMQSRCGSVVSHASLSGVCVSSGMHKMLVFPSGVDLRTSKPAGEAVEAVAGVVFHSQGMHGVNLYMRALQLLK